MTPARKAAYHPTPPLDPPAWALIVPPKAMPHPATPRTLDVSCLVGDCAAISSLSPNSAAAGGPGFNLTVNGSGFLSGELVHWNGSALATTYVSGNQLVAAVPSGLICRTRQAPASWCGPPARASLWHPR